MKFTKQSETQCTVTTADGKEYNFTKFLDIPLQRYILAKPYLLQDELGITFESLHLLFNRLTAIAQNDTATATATKQAVMELAKAFEAKLFASESIIQVKLYLAAVCWQLSGEDMNDLDATLQAEKVRIMSSNTKALNFFLRSPLPFENLKHLGAADTLIVLRQIQELSEAMQQAATLATQTEF